MPRLEYHRYEKMVNERLNIKAKVRNIFPSFLQNNKLKNLNGSHTRDKYNLDGNKSI